jgi:hypothetical protein
MAGGEVNNKVVEKPTFDGLQLQAGPGVFTGDSVGNRLAAIEALLGGSVYENLGLDQIILTTADKLRLELLRYRSRLASRREWIAPASLLLALVAALITADFRDILGLESAVWRAVFLICALGSFVWLLVSLVRAIKGLSRDVVEELIARVKGKPHE